MENLNGINYFFFSRYIITVFTLCVSLLATAQKANLYLVSANNCGVEGEQPFLVKGDNYKLPENFKGTEKALTCNFGGTVIYAFNNMDIQANYQLEIIYLADKDRVQQIVADGDIIHGPVELKSGKEQRYLIDLPKKSFAYSQLVLVFEEVSGGSNAIISELNIYSSNDRKLKPFEGESKEELYNTPAYVIDTDVDVEKYLPIYVPIAKNMEGTYQTSLSLNGVWKFKEKAGNDLFSNKNSDNWNDIIVPGQWSMQGFKVDSAEYAVYQKDFNIPNDWNGKNIRIRFDGVSSESEIYVNSTKVGEHMGGMTAFEIDITKALKNGANRLSVKVRNESMADMLGSLTQYAAHQIGGITRKVTLFAIPEVYISDLRIETVFDDEYMDAELKTYVTVTNTTNSVQNNLAVRISIENLPVIIESEVPSLSPNQVWSGWLKGHVDSPKKWDNEHPNLYTMKIDLNNDGLVTEQIEKRVGFREIKVDGTQLLVNGKSVKLAGVCRHEVHPLTGRVINEELQRKDVELYRAANVNFIRTSHYPPGEELLEICDELGMFVEIESPICWIGHHANENWKKLNYRDDHYYDYVLQANMETIHFYRNHPSVIFWSMANESYWNKGFAQLYEYVKKADTTRPAAFHDQSYGGFNNQGSTAAIANIHYPGPNGYLQAEKSTRPMVYGEYCHLNVYNRSETVTDPGVRSDWALALTQAWEGMYKTKEVLGGSIWSGIDDIFQLPNGDAVGYGPWGPIDGWRRPKPEYWDMKKVYSPIRVLTNELTPGNRLKIEVENRYTFMNTNELKIDWSYGEENGIVFADIDPKEQGIIYIDIVNPSIANELYISFTDPRGFVADEYRIPVGKQDQNDLPELESISTKIKTTNDRYIITGKGFQATISRSNGQIKSMKSNGKEIITGGPWLMALPLNGEGCFPDHNADTPLYNDLCSNWKLTSISAELIDNNVVIKASGSYTEFEGDYKLIINGNGEFTVDYSFDALYNVNPRQWGVVFDVPNTFDQAFWRRKGMWTVYPEDHISRPVGEAKLFYSGLPDEINPRIEPTWSWSYDYNELGSSDFRSTRRDIWYAGLKDMGDSQVIVKSDGTQSWRSWLAGDKIQFLIADFVSPGNEMFLESYYGPLRKPIKVGDNISGIVTLRIK